ncbi:STAS domain-containing protein [Streptomyces sp. 7R007]
MNITTVTDGTHARIIPHGEIDADTLPPLRAAVAALPPDISDVVFDLHATAFMDAAGLRLLFEHSADAPPHRRTVTGLRRQPLRLLLMAADLNPVAYDLARILPDTLPVDF